MKTLFILVSLMASTSHAAIPSCNQSIYDDIYKSILKRAVESEFDTKDIKLRNNTINMLRKLCRGQRSTLEKGKLGEYRIERMSRIVTREESLRRLK